MCPAEPKDTPTVQDPFVCRGRRMPPPNNDVTDISGVNIWEWKTCCFFGPSVNFVVVPDVLSVLLGTRLSEFPVPWYPPHGDRIALCVVVDKVPEIAVCTFPVWLRLTPPHNAWLSSVSVSSAPRNWVSIAGGWSSALYR